MEISFDLNGAFGDGLRQALKEGMTEAVRRVANEVRTEILRSTTGGNPLNVRTGNLRRSWSGFPRVEETGEGPVATLRSASVYSAIHEFGGTIRPVRAAFLTIPLPGAMNASGTRTPYSARELHESPGLAGFKSTFINRSRTAILGVLPGGGLVPLFAIKDSVVMPARHYISKAVDRVKPRVQDIVDQAINAVVRRLGL